MIYPRSNYFRLYGSNYFTNLNNPKLMENQLFCFWEVLKVLHLFIRKLQTVFKGAATMGTHIAIIREGQKYFF